MIYRVNKRYAENRGRKQAKKLLHALEHAQTNRGKEVMINRSVVEVKKEDLAKFFKNYKV